MHTNLRRPAALEKTASLFVKCCCTEKYFLGCLNKFIKYYYLILKLTVLNVNVCKNLVNSFFSFLVESAEY